MDLDLWYVIVGLFGWQIFDIPDYCHCFKSECSVVNTCTLHNSVFKCICASLWPENRISWIKGLLSSYMAFLTFLYFSKQSLKLGTCIVADLLAATWVQSKCAIIGFLSVLELCSRPGFRLHYLHWLTNWDGVTVLHPIVVIVIAWLDGWNRCVIADWPRQLEISIDLWVGRLLSEWIWFTHLVTRRTFTSIVTCEEESQRDVNLALET